MCASEVFLFLLSCLADSSNDQFYHSLHFLSVSQTHFIKITFILFRYVISILFYAVILILNLFS